MATVHTEWQACSDSPKRWLEDRGESLTADKERQCLLSKREEGKRKGCLERERESKGCRQMRRDGVKEEEVGGE